jgi:hypothetical protein
MQRANIVGLERASLFAKEQFDEGLRAAGSGRGQKVGGRKVAARYDLYESKGLSQIRYTGPVHLLYKPTKRHFIGAKLLGTRGSMAKKSVGIGVQAAFGGSNRGAFGQLKKLGTRGKTRRGKQALVFSGSRGPKAYAFHPGTKGRNAWPIVKNRVARGAPDVWALAHRNSLFNAFK